MNTARGSYASEFRPSDRVKVIDGTFVGSEGRVIDVKEAREMWENNGGEQPSSRTPPVCVWVALPVFGRTVPVMLMRDQIQRSVT